MEQTGSYIHLPITLEDELIIELVNLKQGIKGSVVGLEKGKYLIIKIAPNDLIGSFASDLVRETPMVVKYQHKGVVYGFKARILNVVPVPARLFFVSYPDKVEELHVLSSSRYACNLQAVAMFGYQLVEMTVIDMSEDGCLCAVKSSPADKALYDSAQVNKMIELKVQLPGAAGRADLAGMIKNVSKDDDRIHLGIKFDEISPAVKAKLRGFLSGMTEAEKKQ
jgi:PilZ domain-containing protein/flagellar protein YcgR